MRFAFWKFNDRTQLIVDVKEAFFPINEVMNMDSAESEKFLESMSLVNHEYENLPLYLAYGTFLFNDKNGKPNVHNHLKSLSNHIFMTFRWTKSPVLSYETVGLIDITTPLNLDSVFDGYMIPIAALVLAPGLDILIDDGYGVSYFLSSSSFDPFHCLLNRKGIIFFNAASKIDKTEMIDLSNEVDIEELQRNFQRIKNIQRCEHYL